MKSPARTRVAANLPRQHRAAKPSLVVRGRWRYSPATFTGAASAEPLFASSMGLLLGARLAALRAAELFDNTKSEMRGTISDRNREPLNTP